MVFGAYCLTQKQQTVEERNELEGKAKKYELEKKVEQIKIKCGILAEKYPALNSGIHPSISFLFNLSRAKL